MADNCYCQHPSGSPGVTWEQAKQRESREGSGGRRRRRGHDAGGEVSPKPVCLGVGWFLLLLRPPPSLASPSVPSEDVNPCSCRTVLCFHFNFELWRIYSVQSHCLQRNKNAPGSTYRLNPWPEHLALLLLFCIFTFTCRVSKFLWRYRGRVKRFGLMALKTKNFWGRTSNKGM